MHSVLCSRDGNPFLEGYWKPFDEKFLHRFSSVTKSFVGLAVVLLANEGKIALDDPLYPYFPDKCPEEIPEYLKEQTILDTLTMQTANLGAKGSWIANEEADRLDRYFRRTPQNHPSGTMFWYDSAGSFVLGALVERITGKPFLDYLRDKCLRRMGFSEEAFCLKTPDGYSWGDSGLLATTRDMHRLGYLLMNNGVWEGEQLIPEECVKMLTGNRTATPGCGERIYHNNGYGMQVWRTFGNGFSFNGLGGQFMVCIPEKRFLFTCNGDNRGIPSAGPILMDSLYYDIICNLSDEPLPENPDALAKLNEYVENLTLTSLQGMAETECTKTVQDCRYRLDANPMGITDLSLHFDSDCGTVTYHNAQGEKVLPFGINRNVFCNFPEEGYPDWVVNVPEPGKTQPCAVSGTWVDGNKFCIKVQMINKHLGGVFITFGFKDDRIGVQMQPNTETYLREYKGCAGGKKE